MSQNNCTELNNLEWNFPNKFNEIEFSSPNINRLFEVIKRLDKVPLSKGNINFSDNYWDFKPYTLERVRTKAAYNFSDVPLVYLEQVKFFILFSLWNENYKIQTLYTNLGVLKKFLKYIYDNNVYSLDCVGLHLMEKFIKTLYNLQASTREHFKHVISDFFTFCSINYNNFNWNDINKFLNTYDSNACSAQRKNNKWQNINKEYFMRLLSNLKNIMYDKNASIDDRGIASEIILLSQTGLRNQDLVSCTVDGIRSQFICNNSKEAHYLVYYTSKNANGNLGLNEAYTILTSLAYDAFNVLVEVYADKRAKLKSNLLFTPLKAHVFPVSVNALDRYLTGIILKFGKDSGFVNVHTDYPSLKKVSLKPIINRHELSQKCLDEYIESDTVSIPRPHQFRVFLCNELYNQGVPLIYIQKHMTHLTKEMTVYYMRPKEDISEDIEYSKSIMISIVSNETKLLGSNSDELSLKIKNFIKNSKLNIATDLDDIIRKLTKNFPIRAKLGGVCIKSGPIRDCKNNDYTDELFCSYGICPNSFHFYYMIDFTYDRCKLLLKTIAYNKSKGFKKAVIKETNKLRSITQKSLLPEFEELKEQLSKHNSIELIKLHPQLEYFISNLNKIDKEIKKWMR
ncbi:tyrosine-type recombinase/integrase [Clostridium tertium]|uniref:tyrosine-type recombinase/integrase n=1 Tax=Clostridium tertium TaxID=1559 RepID=UPI002330341F|nr:tyrosine-type recombinase/integrase [Clostridium tertium]MDB1940078.1 tyrosine-type recombinase/integrase [Clostridium tertium]